MFDTFWNVISITLGKEFLCTVNYQFNLSFQHYPHLGGMGMFRELNIFFKLHKQYLVRSGLGQISCNPIKRDISLGKMSDCFRGNVIHNMFATLQ